MQKVYFILVVFFISVFIISGTFGQEIILEEDLETEEEQKSAYGIMWGVDFNWSQPFGITHDKLGKAVFGVHTDILFQLHPQKPLFAGIDFFVGEYTSSSQEYYDFLEIDEFLFEEVSHFNLMTIEAKIRYFPGLEFWRLDPFIDLGIGSRTSFGYTQILNIDLDETQSIKFEESDWTLGYSLDFGTLINLGAIEDNIFAHVSIGYFRSNNTFMYLGKENLSGTEAPIDRYDRRSIPLQFFKFNLGLIGYY